MNKKRIEGLIFDLGGTLYHPAPDLIDVARQHLMAAGVDDCENMTDEQIELALLRERDGWLNQYMIEHNVGPHWEPSRELWIEHDRRFLEALCVEGDIEQLAVRYQDLWDATIAEYRYELVEGVREALHQYHSRGTRLAVASNRFGNPTRYLAADGIDSLFEAIEYSNVPGYMKPSPYMLLRVAREMDVNPRLCAYVGNIVEYDVNSAIRAEMLPVLLTWCDKEEERKAPRGTIIIDHLKDLETYVEFPRG